MKCVDGQYKYVSSSYFGWWDAIERRSIKNAFILWTTEFSVRQVQFSTRFMVLVSIPCSLFDCVFLSFLFLSQFLSHSLYRSNPYRFSITCVCLLRRNCPNSNRIILISFLVSCMAFFYQIKMLHNLRQTIGKSILFNNNES